MNSTEAAVVEMRYEYNQEVKAIENAKASFITSTHSILLFPGADKCLVNLVDEYGGMSGIDLTGDLLSSLGWL